MLELEEKGRFKVFFFFLNHFYYLFCNPVTVPSNGALLVHHKEISPERSNMSLILFKFTLKYWPFLCAKRASLTSSLETFRSVWKDTNPRGDFLHNL